MSRFVRDVDFSSLSLRDLLEARDAYHVHLASLENVTATAVGRYRIRYEEPGFKDPYPKETDKKYGTRTLENSGVRRWSWPCVLVFISDWVKREVLASKPAQYIPPRLYLPDGRVVPTCVVLAERAKKTELPLEQLTFPNGMMGGGYPIFTEEQGEQRVGSAGCLVSDGSWAYALTSQHVVGEEGVVAYTMNRGVKTRIGVADRKAQRKLALNQVYPGWFSERSLINVDAGLIRIDELSEWTSQVYGIGQMGELIDLNVDTLDLDLIGCPVRAVGGASGELEGEIQALFYRYRTAGGFDYVADVVIGPRKGAKGVRSRPGDSGTLWFWDEAAESKAGEEVAAGKRKATVKAPPREPQGRAPELRPLAIQWGGHSFLEAGGQAGADFALASSLGNVCRLLDVEIVRDWSIDHSLYWGKVGHYKVGFSASFMLKDAKAAKLFAANAENIAVGDTDLRAGRLPKATERNRFIPLADVADLVWRSTRGKDVANHFADMDEPGANGKTLLQLWKTKSNRTPKHWTEFYDSLPTPPADRHRGALPFRVREFYNAMVGFVKAGKLAEYVCAAGLMAHFVGDACQPLHVSRLHHGHPGEDEDKVHEVYETKMLDKFAAELVGKVNHLAQGKKVSKTFRSGDEAANRVVMLMKETIEAIPPEEVIQVFNQVQGHGQTQNMWTKLGDRTAERIVAGALCLATIWQSAWEEGKGSQKFTDSKLKAIPKNTLKAMYIRDEFVPSRWLKEM